MDCVINPITGRAVKIDSPAGRRALKYIKKNKLESSHECVMNPRTGRAVKKDSAIGRKILKGLITAPAPKPAKAYTMYKKPIGPVKPAPKPAPKPKPAPITIPKKKKYDFGNFKTPTTEPDSPKERIFLSPQSLGKNEKIKSKKKGVIKSPVAKKETKAYTMYKKPIGPVKPPPKAYTMYKKPIGPVKPPPKAYTMYKKPIGPVKPPPKAYTMYKKPIGPVKPPPKAYTMYKKPIGPVKLTPQGIQTRKDEYSYFKNGIAMFNRRAKEARKNKLEKYLNVINEYLELYYKDNKITTQNEKDIIMAKIFKNIDFSIYENESFKYDADGTLIRDDYYIEMENKIRDFIDDLEDEIKGAKRGEKITELTLIEDARGLARQNKTNNKLATLEEFINDTENYLNKKSTRAYKTLIKKYDDKEYISSIIGAQMFGDFYPTSQKCLDHYSDYLEYLDKDDVILEPTAGLGSIVLWLLKNNVKSKIITTDYDTNLNGYLKENFNGIKRVSVLDQEKSNYLKVENDFHRYEPTIIFLNPPFSNGNDKKYYLNFLFKALSDLRWSRSRIMERQLFFISPPLTKGEKDGGQINFEDIVISPKKKEEIRKMLKITKKDEWILTDGINPNQIKRVGACNDFGGTNTEAVLYHMVLFNTYYGEEKK